MNQISKYRIQILDTDTGEVVFSTLPGMAVERQLVAEIVNRSVAKGVGFFRTEAKVSKAIHEAITELLLEMKKDVPAKPL